MNPILLGFGVCCVTILGLVLLWLWGFADDDPERDVLADMYGVRPEDMVWVNDRWQPRGKR